MVHKLIFCSAINFSTVLGLITRCVSVSAVIDAYPTTTAVASIIAHELGHNFGLNHNPEDSADPCSCKSSSCVMDAVGSFQGSDTFTDCQQHQLRSTLQSGAVECLHDQPAATLEEPFCGDYLVNQDSEQCDCGSVQTCEDPCCDAATCKLVQGRHHKSSRKKWSKNPKK